MEEGERRCIVTEYGRGSQEQEPLGPMRDASERVVGLRAWLLRGQSGGVLRQ